MFPNEIVDIGTLQQCNQDLISSINEVVRIHEKGAEQRIRTQGELTRIEAELKQALLEASNRM